MPDLVQDDQLVLIKAGFFEVWLTRMARMFNQMENYVTFEDGSMIHRDELSVVYAVSIRTKVLEEEVFYAPCVTVSFSPVVFFPEKESAGGPSHTFSGEKQTGGNSKLLHWNGRSGRYIVSGLCVCGMVKQTFKVGNNILSYWT